MPIFHVNTCISSTCGSISVVVAHNSSPLHTFTHYAHALAGSMDSMVSLASRPETIYKEELKVLKLTTLNFFTPKTYKLYVTLLHFHFSI